MVCAGRRHRALAARHRTDRRRMSGGERVEQRFGRCPVQVFVEIVVDLEDRRVDAGAETFDLDQRELAVRGAFATADAELLLAGSDDVVRAAQPARRRRTGLQKPAPDRPQIEHRVEGRDLVDADRRHVEHLADVIHRRLGQPVAALALRQVEQGQHSAGLPPRRVFSNVVLRLFEVLGGERETRRLLERWSVDVKAHRSISPKTMSIEPTTATRSASMWPLHMNSVACRKAKPGARILQR